MNYTENLIPKMTSDTAPSGKAFASSFNLNGAFMAFDNSDTYGFMSGNGSVGHLGYEFVNSARIGKYIVRSLSATYFPQMPKNWTFEGSNDGVSWTVLDTQSNQIWTTPNTDKEYIIEYKKVKSYKTYRLNWSANNRGAQVVINELKMFGVGYVNKFLISSEDKYYSVSTLKYSDNTVIPQMTSNTAPSGIASASNTNNPSFPYRAFDGDIGGTWYATASFPITLQYEFTQSRVIGKYSLLGYTAENNSKSWTFEGSNDGVKWTILDEQENQTNWTVGEVRSFSFKNTASFKIYRININSNNGGSLIQVAELLMYEILEQPKMKFLDTMSESNFLSYGHNVRDEIDMHFELSERSFQNSNTSILGSGKVFKQKIDTSKTPIKKASIT
ncbi:discoidin domain-containing protein [Paenibacillus sp. ClWae2A]|uniref:discoidin domain-containing protein n=1 Tax=Paenibacillus sp. ClWae2A TaxID=3057177 RepID=UPI0028F5F40A|nr:discoidin domain-containing protein [Paenibacillus sp. ClWae2A]MDT9719212.1 discoidin domain-containing protein [Paenibacillus sp. ClWae2A]